jgi:hypothetical protein
VFDFFLSTPQLFFNVLSQVLMSPNPLVGLGLTVLSLADFVDFGLRSGLTADTTVLLSFV